MKTIAAGQVWMYTLLVEKSKAIIASVTLSLKGEKVHDTEGF